jgi:predicted nucleotidyltransferase
MVALVAARIDRAAQGRRGAVRALVRPVIELPEDFRDLLCELADAGAEFAVVGGHAVAYHGHVRATKDLDVLIRAHPDNARRVYRALAAFGAPIKAFEVSAEDFTTYDGVLQIGVPPFRIDVLNRIAGVTFDEVTASGDAFELDGRRIPVIGREALLANKQAAGRPQDMADVAALQQRSR